MLPPVLPRPHARTSSAQVRKFKPEMVAIRDASKIPELKEAIKDLAHQPVILAGDEGAVEVARHEKAEVSHARPGPDMGRARLSACADDAQMRQSFSDAWAA